MTFSLGGKMDLISVIVPVYKVEKYLKKCIDSIINQTYKNLEIILIDDGSPDNSGKICDEYAEKDKRIRVIHKINEGVSAARNLGINICSGKYVAFVDSDDWISEDYYEVLYKNLIETNADIATVTYNVVREDNTIIDNDENLKISSGEIITYSGSEIMRELMLQKTIKNFLWLKLYKKELLCDFQVGVIYEDIIWTYQVLNKASKIVYIHNKGYNYLKRGESYTAVLSEKNLSDFKEAITGRYKLMNENYPELHAYNIYAFMESAVAISTKNAITNRQYEIISDAVNEFVDVIKTYSEKHENELLPLLNDYQRICLYLMRYNIDLYYSFLKERQNLKILGKIK